MPRIAQSTQVSAPVDRVFAVARNVESFPDFMEDLQSLRLISTSDDGNTTVTEWVGLIKEFRMTVKWTQEDRWDPELHRDEFHMIKGDMDSMSGFWQFTADGATTTFESVVDYEYNVPLIGPMIKGLIQKKMEQNLDAQMQAIKARAEAGP